MPAESRFPAALRLLTPLFLSLATAPPSSAAQTLAPEILSALRRGVSRVDLPNDSVSVPLLGRPEQPQIDLKVGNRVLRVLIDLGSNVTLLRRDGFIALGGQMLVDRATTDIGLIPQINLGPVRMDSLVVGIYDSLDVPGVLGYNALQHTSFTVDFPRKRLTLHRRSLPEPDGSSVLTYRLEGRLPYVMVRIGPDTVWMNLDTGASEAMTLPPEFEARLQWREPPAAGPTVSNNQTGAVTVRRGILKDTVWVGRLQFTNVPVYLNPDADAPWLGSALLRKAGWTLDPVSLRLEISASE